MVCVDIGSKTIRDVVDESVSANGKEERCIEHTATQDVTDISERSDACLTYVSEEDLHQGWQATGGNEVNRIAFVACKLEKYFGCRPLDCEWTLTESGKLYILQARPITASESRKYWNRFSILESSIAQNEKEKEEGMAVSVSAATKAVLEEFNTPQPSGLEVHS